MRRLIDFSDGQPPMLWPPIIGDGFDDESVFIGLSDDEYEIACVLELAHHSLLDGNGGDYIRYRNLAVQMDAERVDPQSKSLRAWEE